MLQLDGFLKGKLVREVQKIITGFPIYQASNDANLTLSTSMPEIEGFLLTEGDFKAENPQEFTAFKLLVYLARTQGIMALFDVHVPIKLLPKSI